MQIVYRLANGASSAAMFATTGWDKLLHGKSIRIRDSKFVWDEVITRVQQ